MDYIRQIDERRASERENSLLWAKVVFPDRSTRLDCVVLNLSEGGIKIQVAPTALLPKEFSLRLERGKPERLCRTVWRIGGDVGAKFISAFSNNVNDRTWLFPVDDPRRHQEVRSRVLRHPLFVR